MMPSRLTAVPPPGDGAPQAQANVPTAQAAEAAPVVASRAVTPFAAVGIDNSSPEAFIRSVAPFALRVSRATGIPAEVMIGMAANETGYGKFAEGNNLFGIKGKGTAGSFNTSTWEDYGSGRVTITDNFRAYYSPAESFMDFADLVTTSPRYTGAIGQTTVEGFVDGLRRGGYMTDPDYVQKISGITHRYASVIQDSLQAASATPIATQSRPASVSRTEGVVVPNQLAIGLPVDEAYAACGPVAAMAFAQVYGRNPSPAEAMELARQSGWTASGGMNGIANEQRLLTKMGLPNELELGVSWEHVKSDALQRQPVILSTPGHYFVIDNFNARTGEYHVGQSGKVYRGGSEWMTAAQISGLAGAPSGALYTVHPLTRQPGLSPAPDLSPAKQLPRSVVGPAERAPARTSQGPMPAAPPIPTTYTPPAAQQRAQLDLPPLVTTPAPPAIAAESPPPIVVESAPSVTVVESAPAPPPIRERLPDAPPPAPHAEILVVTPPRHVGPVQAADNEGTVIEPAAPARPASAAPPPSATTRAETASPPVGPGLAIGAVAASDPRPAPPPTPPRRRPEEDEDL